MYELVGKQMGNYHVLAHLGRGGFADVYLGQHMYLKNHAALKVLHRVLTHEEQEAFIKEAQTLVRFQHPHIIRVLDFSIQDDIPFLVMDYIPNGSLRKRYPQGERLPLETIVNYIQQIAVALQYAHDHHVIHCDIKPENMLLDAQQKVLLSDFGLATLHRESLNNPMLHVKVGTIGYMSPEHMCGMPQPASDQYSLGVVIYEWLCGQRPFERTTFESALQERLLPPLPLHELMPTIVPEVEAVVLQALAHDPQQRFASVQEFAQAFVRACQRTPTSLQLSNMPLPVPSDSNISLPGDVPVVIEPSLRESSAQEVTSGGVHTSESDVSSGSEVMHDFSSAALMGIDPGNSAVARTPLIGRDREVEAVCRLYLRQDVRLLTLTGTGGIGKTRLALQVAAQLSTTFRDGRYFIPLAMVSDATQVIPTIVHALGMQEEVDQPLQAQLSAYLQDKHLLLLLDNFEHIMAAAPHLSDLLQHSPGLRVLVTSREALHLPDEHTFAVSSLMLPDSHRGQGSAAIAKVPAIDLFVQRARSAQPDFQLTQDNVWIVADICTHLDGLPLAIELAAARINILPPHALLKRLDRRLNILTSRGHAQSARHQTLRNTIQWSYNLLTPEEQTCFRRLAIFVGGFTLQAAEALCTQFEDGIESSVLDMLSSFIEKNLLQAPNRDEEDPRLSMLETVRYFGLEILQAQGEFEEAQAVHARYMLAFTEEAKPHMSGPEAAAWKYRVEQDLPNVRAALRWSLSYGKQIHAMEFVLRLGMSLTTFWIEHGYLLEGWTFLEQVLAACEGEVDPFQVEVLQTAVQFALLRCDYSQGQRMLEKCHAYYKEQHDIAHLCMTLIQLGWLAVLQVQLRQAHACYEEALSLSRNLENERLVDTINYNRAYLLLLEGKYEQSRALMEEILVHRRAAGLLTLTAATLGDLAQLVRLSSTAPSAGEMQRLLTEALDLAMRADDKNVVAAIRNGMAWVAFIRGDLDIAQQMVMETIAFFKQAGKQQSFGHYLELLARIQMAQGNDEAAHTTFAEGVVQAKKQNDFGTLCSLLIEMAYLAVRQKHYARAMRILGAHEALREAVGLPISPFDRPHYDETIASARGVLGDDAFHLVWAEGRTLSPLDILTASNTVPLQSSTKATKKKSFSPGGLTPREVDVLRLVAQGFTDAQVAEKLVISTRTVTTHLTSIYSKLNINSRAAATYFAVTHHLI